MAANGIHKLWGGRFRAGEEDLMEQFNNNFKDTHWLCDPDIEGSLAHVAMQVECGLLTEGEGAQLTEGLLGIQADVHSGALPLDDRYEDVHTFVEANLIDRLGEVGKKLHTARSRNDQVNTDMKLYVKRETAHVVELVEAFLQTLRKKADENP